MLIVIECLFSSLFILSNRFIIAIIGIDITICRWGVVILIIIVISATILIFNPWAAYETACLMIIF